MNTSRYKVLLVEDDVSAVELARFAVAEFHPEIDLTVVAGGDAVLDWLHGRDAQPEQLPQLILLDLKLPKLDGLAVLRKLRIDAHTRDIPIVAFSGEYTQADVLMSYRVGANSFVHKPTDLEQFKEFFAERLAHWMQQHRNPLASNMPATPSLLSDA